MIKHILFLLLVLMTFSAIAQKPTVWYNHTTLDVNNLDTSVAFYTKVFQVDTIPCPFPPTAGLKVKWLKIGKDVELHLAEFVADTTKYISPTRIGFVHLGFTVTSMDAFLKRLSKVSSDYRTGKLKPEIGRMPYGAKDALIKDPDGNMIHVIEAMPSKQ